MSVDLNSFNAILERLESVADRLEKNSGGAAGAATSASEGPAEAAIALSFDDFVKQRASPIEAAATTLGAADVTEATQFFMECLRQLRSIFAATGACRKPKDDEWGKFFGPYSELSQKANKACDNRSDYFHDRKAAGEALGLITMVTVPGPAQHVQQILEMMDFHAMKVLMKKNPPESAWINALKTCLKELIEWCKENCKMGLDWKAGGQDPVEYFAAAPLGTAAGAAAPAKAPAKGAGKGKGAPPPPKGGFAKPPPPEAAAPAAAPSGGGGGGMSAVFAAINQGGTGGLKKVTDDMKCKNRKDEAPKEVIKPKVAAPAAKAAGRFAKGPKGDPIKTLQEEQNTWLIQNVSDDNNCTLEGVEMQHNLRITDCAKCTVKIDSRVKSVSVDNCLRVNLVLKDVISVVELVNSDKCQIQTTGKVNMIAVDKCDGVGIFLNKDSLGCEIVTSKSSEMNVTIPDDQGDEYDTIEIPIPEQFVTTIAGRKCKTEVSSLYSS